MTGFNDRVKKIRTLAAEKNLDAIVIRRNPNLAWAIAGRVHVPLTLDLACFDLVVTQESVTAFVNNIEAPRLIAEELPNGVEVKVVMWWESREPLIPKGEKVGADQPGGDRINLESEIELLRQSLVSDDIERLREICHESALALGNAVKEIKPTDREIDVAAKITEALWRADLEPVYLGVAGEVRVRKFRHALPTDAVVGSHVVSSICARRKGLIASTTRIVTFGKAQRDYFSDYYSLLNVEAAMFDASAVGSPFSAPIEAAVAAYAANGFDVDEWHNHHQGGPMGYLPRDWTANRSTMKTIQINQPIGWNPTGKGWKAEDTIVTTSNGIEILSVDSTWPSVNVAGRVRPDVLKL